MKRNPGGAPGRQTIGQRPGKGRRRRETEGADKVQKNRGGSTPLSRGESARDVGTQRIAVIFLGAIARHSAQPDRGNGAPEDEGLAGRWERAGGGETGGERFNLRSGEGPTTSGGETSSASADAPIDRAMDGRFRLSARFSLVAQGRRRDA